MAESNGHRGRAPPRPAFEPPPTWPDLPRQIQGREFEVTEAEEMEVDSIVERSRDFVERMKHHPTRLRVPNELVEVQTLSNQKKENELGCVSLREGLAEPLSHLYFPTELHDVIAPSTNSAGTAMALAQNKNMDQFRRKGTPKMSLEKLQRLEGRADPSKEERGSDGEIEEQEEEEDDDEGDYAVAYHSEGDDDEEEEEDQDEPTM